MRYGTIVGTEAKHDSQDPLDPMPVPVLHMQDTSDNPCPILEVRVI